MQLSCIGIRGLRRQQSILRAETGNGSISRCETDRLMEWLTMRGMGWWGLPWLWTSFFLSSGAHQREGLFTRYPGMRIRTPHLTVRLSPGQATACCLTCVQYDSCYGANLHEEDGVCEISLLGVGGRTELVDANQSWNLYIRRNGTTNPRNVYLVSVIST